jgi:hypothetical protein
MKKQKMNISDIRSELQTIENLSIGKFTACFQTDAEKSEKVDFCLRIFNAASARYAEHSNCENYGLLKNAMNALQVIRQAKTQESIDRLNAELEAMKNNRSMLEF